MFGITNFRLLFFLLILSCFACKQNNPQLQEQLVAIQTQLDAANTELNKLKSKSQKLLLHSVFFTLKPEITPEQKDSFISNLKSLSTIPSAKNLFVGNPAQTGDDRLKKDYDLVLQMSFVSLEDLAKYQNHAHHLKVKTEVASFIATKPFVYDYWQK